MGDDYIQEWKKLVLNLYQEFTVDPFIFFNEKDLHFRFSQMLHEKMIFPYEIEREFPVKGFKREAGGLLISDNGTSTSHIDFCVKGRGKTVCYEFYLGKWTDAGSIYLNDKKYLLKESNYAIGKLRTHLTNDFIRVQKLGKNVQAYFAYFFFDYIDPEKRKKGMSNRIDKIFKKINEFEESVSQKSQEFDVKGLLFRGNICFIGNDKHPLRKTLAKETNWISLAKT